MDGLPARSDRFDDHCWCGLYHRVADPGHPRRAGAGCTRWILYACAGCRSIPGNGACGRSGIARGFNLDPIIKLLGGRDCSHSLSGFDQSQEFFSAPIYHGAQRPHERSTGLHCHHDRDHTQGHHRRVAGCACAGLCCGDR